MEEFSIKVPGTDFVINSHSIYEVRPKLDTFAPDAFKQYKTTKPIDPKITTVVYPRFNTDLDVWDLGFHEDSPCLLGMDPDLKKEHLTKVQKYIVEPVEAIKGKGYLNHIPQNLKDVIKNKNGKSLDEHKIILGIGKFFDTNPGKPIDLFNLYVAILNKDLAPKDLEYSQDYDNADFAIENKKEKINQRDADQFQRDKAVAKVHQFLESDKEFIIEVLNYCGVKVTVGSNNQTISTFFRKWIDSKERSGDNAQYFIGVIDKFTTEKGKEELYIYQTLTELYKKGILTSRSGELILNGEAIGNSVKTIAEQAMKVKKLKEDILAEAIQLQD